MASAYTKVQLGVSTTLLILRVEKLRARPSFLLPSTETQSPGAFR
ncbi:hypothetical protein H4W29_006158 [Rhizobium viscosum]|uniref:Uncharacterized protein n=1 Tax=Rhizobium viscosum TaxID=1673 RepID=A0ABR9J0S3_RHIVS|nr:hypothetical protein [Rhizobium viscosum]